MRRISTACVAGLMIVVLAFASCRERAAKLTPIRIGTIRVLSGLPLYVAVDRKLFQKHGFSPAVREFRTSDLVVKALENGEIDLIGCAGTSQVLALSAKEPALQRLIGVLYSSTCIVGSATERPPAAISDLNGATIACFPGSTFKTYTREALAAAGVDIRTVQIVPTPAELQSQSLRERKARAVYTLEPTCAVAVHDGVAQYLTHDDLFAKFFLNGKKFPGGAVTVSRRYLSGAPDRETRLRNVFRDAMTDIRAANFDMSPHLSGHTAINPRFMPVLTYEGAAFSEEIDRDTLNTLARLLVKWEALNPSFKLDSIY